MLAAVRHEVSDLEGLKAIVVVRPTIRRYVRKLVELEFPALSVIAEDELLGDWQTRVVAEIELDAEDP
jgi:type III secretory pathway component EscV